MTKLFTHGFVLKSTLASLLYLFSSSVWAGRPVGTVTYGQATPVPTLSGMMLIVLALLLAAIAFRILRQKDNHAGRMMILSLLAVGTLASGLGGVKLIDNAYAPYLTIELTDPNGSEVNIVNPGLTLVINATGAATTILGLETIAECAFDESIDDKCTVGLKLADTDSCHISVACDEIGNPI